MTSASTVLVAARKVISDAVLPTDCAALSIFSQIF
jgi:hypothetical protein